MIERNSPLQETFLQNTFAQNTFAQNTAAQNTAAQNTVAQSTAIPQRPAPGVVSISPEKQAQIRRWRQWLSQVLSLPADWISFSMFLIVLAVLSGGLMLHIHLSAQIYQTQLEIVQLESVYDEVAHQNTELIWQIGQFTSLNTIYRRAESTGYVRSTQQYYVDAASLHPSVTDGYAATGLAAEPAAVTTVAAALQAQNASGSTAAPASSLLNNSSHPPVWAVRMQQRMANAASRVQSWWQ